MLRIATVQARVQADVRTNGMHLREAMAAAARAGARLVHFPEAALSGYIGTEITDWPEVDWAALDAELDALAALARRLGIWAVVGANHRLPDPHWPRNSLHVISDQGVVTGRYHKRFLSNVEATYWYTPGTEPLVITVDGVRLGLALCIEVVFPHVFAEYERLDVSGVLLSCWSNDPVHGLMARAHAATTCCWVSLSTPVSCPNLPSMLIGPDGNPCGACPPGEPGMVLGTIDPADEQYRVPLQLRRPWRAAAMAGSVYAGRHAPG